MLNITEKSPCQLALALDIQMNSICSSDAKGNSVIWSSQALISPQIRPRNSVKNVSRQACPEFFAAKTSLTSPSQRAEHCQ